MIIVNVAIKKLIYEVEAKIQIRFNIKCLSEVIGYIMI